jgi:hypothetical protein
MPRKKAVTDKLVVTIVIEGENIMGQPLCDMQGILLTGKKVEDLKYGGPVTSAHNVAEALKAIFEEETA